jgi:hypothetical protein
MIIHRGDHSREHARRPDSGSSGAPARVDSARRLIATANDEPTARRARDWLTYAGLPGDQIAIVGRDLQTAPAPGAPNTVRAAARGVLPGVIVGVLVGVVLRQTGLVTSDVPLSWLTVAAALIGATIGAVSGVLWYGLSARRTVQPEILTVGHFDVLVDVDAADEAVRVLHRAAGPAA